MISTKWLYRNPEIWILMNKPEVTVGGKTPWDDIRKKLWEEPGIKLITVCSRAEGLESRLQMLSVLTWIFLRLIGICTWALVIKYGFGFKQEFVKDNVLIVFWQEVIHYFIKQPNHWHSALVQILGLEIVGPWLIWIQSLLGLHHLNTWPWLDLVLDLIVVVMTTALVYSCIVKVKSKDVPMCV